MNILKQRQHKGIYTLACGLLMLLTCSTASAQKYVGGDISMLPAYEKAGATYYTHSGQSISDVITYFKEEGMNAMRVRLFVNPTKQTTNENNGTYTWVTDDNVCQNLSWVESLGKRIKDAGLKFMLDIHYSDTWADPGKQWTPAAWASLSDDALATKVYDYTKDVLTQLKAAGAEPDFVQTGNEISYGMLWGRPGSTLYQCWPSSSNNWSRFEKLLGQATKATREVCPDAKIILHVERVSTSQQNDNKSYAALKYFYQQMATAKIDYDIIGLSYYPYFHGPVSEIEGAINYLETAYPSKDIMIVETGYPYSWAVNGTTYNYSGTYAYSDAGQKSLTDALITMLNKHSKVTGLFWWWPEYNAKGTSLSGWYNAPLFDSRTGRATSAVSSLKNFLTSSTGIKAVKSNGVSLDDSYYNLSGQRVSKPQQGVYIHQGKKVVR